MCVFLVFIILDVCFLFVFVFVKSSLRPELALRPISEAWS